MDRGLNELAQKLHNPKPGEVPFRVDGFPYVDPNDSATSNYPLPSNHAQHCEPNEDQRAVLWDLFTEAAGGGDRITKSEWEDLLTKH